MPFISHFEISDFVTSSSRCVMGMGSEGGEGVGEDRVSERAIPVRVERMSFRSSICRGTNNSSLLLLGSGAALSICSVLVLCAVTLFFDYFVIDWCHFFRLFVTIVYPQHWASSSMLLQNESVARVWMGENERNGGKAERNHFALGNVRWKWRPFVWQSN